MNMYCKKRIFHSGRKKIDCKFKRKIHYYYYYYLLSEYKPLKLKLKHFIKDLSSVMSITEFCNVIYIGTPR